MLLKGKTVIVTGCNRGIGKAIFEDVCIHGADVFAVVRKESGEFIQRCEKMKEQYKVNIDIVYADFADEEQVKKAAKQILATKKPIDGLINNIGIANPLNMLAMTRMETIRDTFEVNFFSTIFFTQLISKAMMRKKQGSIIFVSSSAAYDGGANVEYSASKAAIIGAARRLAVELGKFCIRVNVIAPGLTSTDMGNSMSKDDEEIAIGKNIMHRKGQPMEVADAAVFLSSDMSGFITGQVLRVDGGLL